MRREWMVSLLVAAAFAQAHSAFGQPFVAEELRVTPVYAAEQAPADWADPIKKPLDCLTLGADLRLRHEHLYNHLTLSNDGDNEWSYERFRARIWSTFTPVKELDLNIRFTWEGRHWWLPDSREEWAWSDVLIDTLNVKIKEPFGLPATATIGRQDIAFGDWWLIADGTPLDGSRTMFFDAARLTVALKDARTAVDLIYVNQFAEADHWLPPIGNNDIPLIEQDERGIILYVSNQSIEKTQLDGYFVWKRDDRVLANGDQGDIYTIGGRATRDFGPNWAAKLEGAYQWGQRSNPVMFGPGADTDLSAWGAIGRLAYKFNDDWKNQIRFTAELLSGDDPDSSTNEQFDPLWGRWPQWSELLIYTYATETRVAETTNLMRGSLAYMATPAQNLDLRFEYSLLWAMQNTFGSRPGFDSAGDFRGQLFQAVLMYKFDAHLSGHLWGEYFIPGNYYADTRDDAATFLRAQLILAL